MTSTWEDARRIFRKLQKERPFSTAINMMDASMLLKGDDIQQCMFLDWVCNPSKEPRQLKKEDLTYFDQTDDEVLFEAQDGHIIQNVEYRQENGRQVCVISTGPPESSAHDDDMDDEKKMDS